MRQRMGVTPVILIEFNELCPDLLAKWLKAGELPNVSGSDEASQVFITRRDVTDPVFPEPWIQWYSLHTGLSFEQHRVFHLVDGPRHFHRDIWSLLSEQGQPVWICSSMNARAVEKPGSAFLPDPWCTNTPCHPQDMAVYHDFVSRHVQEYTNRDRSFSVRDYARFGLFLVSHGLSAKTVARTAVQLISDAVSKGRTKWQRASMLDRFQLDLFRHYYRRLKPALSTFFANSTAHYQHSYWRHMAPEVFQVVPTEEERKQFRDAILFGYRQMDSLLGDFFQLERESGALLVLTTALSQQPFLKRETRGGQRFYRPRDLAGLLTRLHVRYQAIEPVMAHQFQIRFRDPAQKSAALDTLARLSYHGEPLFGLSDGETDSIYLGCQVFEEVPGDATVELGNG